MFLFYALLSALNLFHLVFSAASSSSAQDPAPSRPQLSMKDVEAIGLQKAILTDSNTPFFKVDDDVFCDDYEPEKGSESFFGRPLFSGRVATFGECKSKCINADKCKYMAYWRSKKCETYLTCYKRSKDGTNKIGLYRKQSPCDGVRDVFQDLIAKEFEPNTLRPIHMPFEWEKYEGNSVPLSISDNPNFLCFCTGVTWMTCGIFLQAASQTKEVIAIASRLKREPKEMMPFAFMKNALADYGGEKRFLIYERSPSPGVTAELALMEHAIDYTQVTSGCLHINKCSSPNCPLQRRPLEPGDPVYIMKDSMIGYTTPNKEKPIDCISVKGLRSHVMQPENIGGGFRDPLGRVREEIGEPPREKLTIDGDYLMFFVFDDVSILSGICTWVYGTTEGRSGGAVGPSEAGPSDLTEPISQMGLEDDPSGKKKKKKKKKGKQLSGTSASSPDVEEGPKQADAESLAGPSSSSPELSGNVQSSPSSMPEPSLLGPSSFPDHLLPPALQSTSDQKLRVTLSDSDIDKMRRSFKEAKARRESKRREQDDRLGVTSALKKAFDMRRWVELWLCISLFAITFFLSTKRFCFSHTPGDVYIAVP